MSDEKNKIINIINSEKDKYLVETDENVIFYVSKLADILIAANIGDIEYWKQRALSAEKDCKIRDIALENLSRNHEIMTGWAEDEADLDNLVQNRVHTEIERAKKEASEI